ncbi:hypothetical protein SAMN05216236_1016 [Sedimentitalea nanhaiensis]|uniref:Uncharacterized protein n=1 Tax=Sedimentitalea nanhaiensis TaxID=999627 RepID=A0A1I6X452_9RHOB|nr:hypothetical protein SAMN05216236_1016 [Sedimentitalea nanhaiensis]
MAKLSKRIIDALQPEARDYFVRDSQIPGSGCGECSRIVPQRSTQMASRPTGEFRAEAVRVALTSELRRKRWQPISASVFRRSTAGYSEVGATLKNPPINPIST